MNSILTCVYCGMAYPEGTPPHGAKVLTDHIKVCDKHPMRDIEIRVSKLRQALIDLVGVSTKEDLEAMEMCIRSTTAPITDKSAALNAIHVLLETI